MIFNAHAHPLLQTLCSLKRCTLLQSFKPESNTMEQAGLHISGTHGNDYDLALVLPSKNKLQTFGWMAKATACLHDGGKIIMACANRHGAKSYEAALKKLCGNISSASKSKCRIFSAIKNADLDSALASQWQKGAQPQRIESHGLFSQPGLFSWDRPDPGSSLLLEHLPKLSGTGMDLCCGYGLLAHQILQQSDNVRQIHLVEADLPALSCAEKNTANWHEKVRAHWLDAASESMPEKLDWIVCNPPFHTGQERSVELGQAIVRRACKSLKTGGELWLVANRKLPYECVLKSELKTLLVPEQSGGFKIIRGIR